jgi:hypothetical protein
MSRAASAVVRLQYLRMFAPEGIASGPCSTWLHPVRDGVALAARPLKAKYSVSSILTARSA